MKKTIFAIAVLAAMTSCSQEMTNIDPQQPKGQTVTIEARLDDTKVAVDDNSLNVFWKDTDEISVLVKEADNNWSANTKFTKKVKGDINDFTFEGTFADPQLKDGANSWFLLHPYDKDIYTINGETKDDGSINAGKVIYKSGSKSTEKNYSINIENPVFQDNTIGAKAHIQMPMYGVGTGNGVTTPKITMAHFCSLFEVTVNNPSSTEAINISSVTIEAPAGKKINGPFRIRVNEATTDKAAFMALLPNTAATEKAVLRVRNSSIDAGKSAKFYIMTAPFTIAGTETAPETIKVTVQTDKDALTVSKEIKKTQNFAAGKVHKTIIDYKNAIAFETAADISSSTIDFTKMTDVPSWIITRNGNFNVTLNGGMFIPGDPNEKHRVVIDTKQEFTKVVINRASNKGACTVALKDSKTGKYPYTVEFKNKEKDTNEKPILSKTIEVPAGFTAKGIRFDTAKGDVTIANLTFTLAQETQAK